MGVECVDMDMYMYLSREGKAQADSVLPPSHHSARPCLLASHIGNQFHSCAGHCCQSHSHARRLQGYRLFAGCPTV